MTHLKPHAFSTQSHSLQPHNIQPHNTLPTTQTFSKLPSTLLKAAQKIALSLIGGLAVFSQADAAFAGMCRAELPRKVDAIINGYTLEGANVGVLIEDANPDTRTLYAHRAQEKFVPASNVKLLTTAAALHNLGPNFSIRTSVLGSPTAPIQTCLL